MDSFEIVSGLIDFSIYAIGIFAGLVLFNVGRRREGKSGAGTMRGFGVLLMLVFGLGAIPAFVQSMNRLSATGTRTSVVSLSYSLPTTTAVPATTKASCDVRLASGECVDFTSATETSPGPASRWAERSEDAAAYWAESALDYIKSQGWRFDDPAQAQLWLRVLASQTCSALSRGGDPVAQEAAFRERLGIERWQAWGSVLFDDLVNGLCIRR